MIGVAVLLLGAFIVTRPLTSLWLLAILVGISAILSGVLGLSDADPDPANVLLPARRAASSGIG